MIKIFEEEGKALEHIRKIEDLDRLQEELFVESTKENASVIIPTGGRTAIQVSARDAGHAAKISRAFQVLFRKMTGRPAAGSQDPGNYVVFVEDPGDITVGIDGSAFFLTFPREELEFAVEACESSVDEFNKSLEAFLGDWFPDHKLHYDYKFAPHLPEINEEEGYEIA